MKPGEFISRIYHFLRRHRIVVLIVGVIALGSAFSIYMLSRRPAVETPASVPRRGVPKISLGKPLPAKPLLKWGEDPFKDVIIEKKIEDEKRRKAQALKAKQDAEKIAREEIFAAVARAKELTAKKKYQEALAQLEAAVTKHRDSQVPILGEAQELLKQIGEDWKAAAAKAEKERELRERQEKERRRWKNVILSLRIDGIISGDVKEESYAIIEGKSYSVGDTVIKNGIEAVIESIEPNGVRFKDPESGDKCKVPLAR